MSRGSTPWSMVLLLALVGCAAQVPSSRPAVPPAADVTVAAPAEAGEPSPLPPLVTENQTFVTVDGVPWYKIGPGDILDVVLTTELAQERLVATVRADGTASVGFFEAAVAGLTTEQAGSEIHRVLAPTHRELRIEVTVKEHKSRIVSVLGDVKKEGRFPLRGKTNLLDLLIDAGGLTPTADLGAIRLLRPDGQSYTINLFRLVSEGQRFRELIVDAGDVVFIPPRRPEEQKVFVLGEVRSPGAHPLLPNMRLSQALAVAGGPTDTARLDSARVIRGDLGNPEILATDFRRIIQGRDMTQDLVLQANDLIIVPRSGIANWNAFLARIRPTLDILTFPLQTASQYLLLRELLKD